MFKEVPAQFDFPAAEREILRFWEENRIFEKSLKQREGAPIFVFYEGPPTANGLPHPGHCLTRTIKDVFPRYKTMTGFYCPRKGGWDTHGLPVETEVCKELGIHTKQDIEKYGVEKFIHLCQQSVFRYMKEWEDLTRRLGFWMDLKEAYVTYHQSYVESIWWALKTLFDKGLLYQGHKIVWWWPQGGTALSAGEVGQGYREVDDPSVYVRFRVKGQPKLSLLAWTTTPWTLPSNVALAVHPEFTYAQIAVGDEEFILAQDLIPAVFKGLPVKLDQDVRTVRTMKGSELVGMQYEPLFSYVRPEGGKAYEVVTADFVTLDTGTGIVHIAPAFGEDDHKLMQEKGLGFLQLVAPDGRFVPEVTDFPGMFCKAADPEIIRNLKERGLLLKREQYRHEYPFCWRAEQDPLIQYARKSWFIRTTAFREEFLKNNEQINWLPEHIKAGRFGNFLEANVDWALSRERFWGTPLPIWECEKTGRQEAVCSYAELLGKPGVQGTEVWEEAKRANPGLPDDLKVHKPYIDAVTYDSPFAPGARMRRVPEVIDVWFDSGCMPFAQWGYPNKPGSEELFKSRFPADFISEAIDQTRGWFYTLLSISTMLFGEKGARGEGRGTREQSSQNGDGTFTKEYPHPFRNCIVLGLMSGEDGKKLSKSKRNYKEPSYIFDREGADAMRWSMLSAQAPWTGVRFSQENIATDQREFLIKLYNVYSFFTIYANIDGWTPSEADAANYQPSELDRWLMAELQQTIVDVRAAMDRYENYPACRRLVEFVDALSNWYVRRSRDRFWRSGKDADKTAAYITLWRCLSTTAELIAPFTPFFAETLYQNLVRPHVPGAEESVHLRKYPEADPAAIDRRLIEEMAIVREIASLGRAARMDAKMKVRQPLPVVELVLANPEHRSWLEGHLPLIAEELNVRSVEFAADADRYVTYEVKPNFKTIGPKFGKLAPKLKAVLPTLNAADLRRQLDTAGKIALTVDGQTLELSPEDVQVTLKAKEGWAAAQGRMVVVVLSTALTPELKAEGLARDFVHLVQTARKEQRLDYQDRIRLRVSTAEPVQGAIEAFRDYIQGETLAVELLLEPSVPETAHGGEIEGTPVRFSLEVVGKGT
ncbi:MAG TPA: isoleucine--tRNA ligase [Phycisphaerae bacterium]|jgi:isoleucyl-tRNA synthetase|nr:isoleucine--tRNA ligase [Phycisphaerae bacterium]HOJ53188.1 isoleucine--tRNA ligase [Phycisphaerae bacterium]HOL25152.1 isoleucine--tRNA ligase [Phycisphaerae bacterium]HPP20294.1 isoleucine--tRNA ligase [Phycisphaerae bacterium]HPU32351.1 isoleucine--tRNA ligase [Phycisphaerae bacterium]